MLKTIINNILNEISSTVSGDDIRDLLVKNAYMDGKKFEYEDAKNFIPGKATFKLVNLPLNTFKFHLNLRPNYKNRSNFPPVVIKDEYGYEVIDGKHRISLAKDQGLKDIQVYLADITGVYEQKPRRTYPANPYLKNINESLFNQSEYLKWKRKNVTIRGVSNETWNENGAGASLGNGLYTAFLSNKAMAKQYGEVYFVLGAIPKHPKVFNTLNEWEIWFYNTLVYKYSKAKGKEFPDKRDFTENTTIEKEMQKLGFDGVVIKGREMVNYTPNENEIKYFKTEKGLIDYYETK